MPYIVQRVIPLYAEGPDDGTVSGDIAAWLNEREAEGYQLAGVIQDHRVHPDATPTVNGCVGAMLVMHKPKTPAGATDSEGAPI